MAQWKYTYYISYGAHYNGVFAELDSDAPTRYYTGMEINFNLIKTTLPKSLKKEFNGWYTDSEFKYRKNELLPNQITNLTLYAKWDDTATHTRSATYTITDSGRFYQSYDMIQLDTKTNYSELKKYKITKLTVTISLKLWEVNDGYQYIFIYNCPNDSNTELWSTKIDHGGTGVNTKVGTYNYTVTLDLEQIKNTDILYIRYGASGVGKDDWKNSNLEVHYSYQ